MNQRRETQGSEINIVIVNGQPITIGLRKQDGTPDRIYGWSDQGEDVSFFVHEVDITEPDVAAWVRGFRLGALPAFGEFCGDLLLDVTEEELALETYRRRIDDFMGGGRMFMSSSRFSLVPDPSEVVEAVDVVDVWTICGGLILVWDKKGRGWRLMAQPPYIDGPFLPGSECAKLNETLGEYHAFNDPVGEEPYSICVRCGYVTPLNAEWPG